MSAVQQLLLASKASGSGQQVFTSSGTWVCPAGVTKVSVVCVGRGGASKRAGGGGGALAYVNDITVTPGNSYTITIDDTASVFGADVVKAGAGEAAPSIDVAGAGGSVIVGTGGAGGAGAPSLSSYYSGGGGAGGYAGAGGTTPSGQGANGVDGSGGGGGSAANMYIGAGFSHPGGGVGLLGQGSNGVGGRSWETPVFDGFPGSSGSGQTYGGGGGSTGAGAVRIIWPGNLRQFPSTRTADE